MPGTRKISRKKEILKKATHMFRERGYASATVRDLAQEVGIEAPSIYSHFKSKEHILRHICFEMAGAFMEGLKKAESEKSLQDQLYRAIKEHSQIVLNHKEASAVMWSEWKFLTNPSHDQFQKLKKEYEFRFCRILQKGVVQGVFRHQNPEIASNIILSSLNGLSHWYKNEILSEEALEQELSEIYLKGILK